MSQGWIWLIGGHERALNRRHAEKAFKSVYETKWEWYDEERLGKLKLKVEYLEFQGFQIVPSEVMRLSFPRRLPLQSDLVTPSNIS